MATDKSALLSQVAQEIVDGLRSTVPNFDDQICTVREVDAISGSIPYLAAADSLGKDLGALDIGSDPLPVDMHLSSVTYKLKRYAHSISMDESEVRDLDQYMSTLGEVAQMLLEYNAIARQADLAALMTDSNYNGQHAAATGAWSLTTSTPVLDMQEAKRLDAPRADTVVLGITSAHELARHPDITSRVSNYASGAGIGFEQLKGIIAELLNLPSGNNVFIWDTFYNSAKFGQSASLSYVTGDFCWLGEKKGLLKIAQRGANGITTVETNHLKTETAVSDTCAFTRVETYFGTEVTGL